MSNAPSEQPNLTPLDEQLVAYLDGELEPQATKQVEELLAGDETARNRLSQLAASWDLLDQLPRATVDDLFTRTTVQMVAVAAEDELAQVNATRPSVRRRRWLEGALATAAAAMIGFAIVSVGLPSENKLLLRDLPVVQDLELYKELGSYDYLTQLQKTRLILDDASDAPTAVATAPADSHPATATATTAIRPVPKSADERRAWVDALTPAEKLDLRDRFEKFAALSAAQQESLREFEDQVQASPNAESLHRLMLRYYDWLKTLSPLNRNKLREETNPEKRYALAKDLKTEQEQRVFTSLPRMAVPKDSDNLIVIAWMWKFVETHRAELNGLLEEVRPEGAKSHDPRRSRPEIMQAYRLWWAPLATKSAPVSDAELKALVADLSPERQQAFAEAIDRAAQLSLLDKWIQHAVEAQMFATGGFRGGRQINLDNLPSFEKSELTDKQRQELQELPEGQRRHKLIEWFMQSGRPPGGRRGPGGFQRPPDGQPPEGPPPGNQQPGGPPRDPPPPRNDRI
jgi:hypothetical protein